MFFYEYDVLFGNSKINVEIATTDERQITL